MKPKIVAIGAFLLVLGAALIGLTPVLTEAALYTAEIALSTSVQSDTNATSLLISERNVVTQYELLAVLGVVLAALGAGILGYGLSATGARETEKSMDATPPPSGGTPGTSA
jgi:hypothetical protein